jgi:hypothetical protein
LAAAEAQLKEQVLSQESSTSSRIGFWCSISLLLDTESSLWL